MRSFPGLVVGFLMLVAYAGVLVGADGEKMPDYFPLKVGTKRTYRVDNNGKTGQLTTLVSKVETIDGQPLAVMETLARGMLIGTEHFSSSAKGVFRHRASGVEAVPPVCMLKYPVKKGEVWEQTTKLGPQTAKTTCKVTGQDVSLEVPAGKYKAVTVEMTVDLEGTHITTTFWFAPDVGIVKQLALLGTNTVTWELEKFELGK